ncbi:hypothetical protein [Chitinophaga qingshengii]|uniref:DUF3592 domain-containing protein n=1 Tax=Chitinophaga qingshengii TaxID=1569794 RepID=A0ABR7TUQ6_9BACT|nr:hypothetical protein [Chitinophaga qingshengii]MBC9933343.1 hypothetical protein [Chitinophaga qingshengii]
MYIVLTLTFVFAGMVAYAIYKARTTVSAAISALPVPPEGENAIAAVLITGITNSTFTVTRYLRNIRNASTDRFVTVAIRQIVSTPVGTTTSIRVMENLAPGTERTLGHVDNVQDGKSPIYIGYEIIWARYTPAPLCYPHTQPSAPHMGWIDNAELKPGLLYQILMLEQ